MARRPDSFGGIDLTSPVNRIPAGRVALAVNVRAYTEGGFTLRNVLSAPIITVDSSINTLARMNDTTPAGPADGYAILVSTDSGTLWTYPPPGPAEISASGLSGNPISILPFRPNASVQPWAYIGDSAPAPDVTVSGGFHTTGMIKVRSDGLSEKTGIQEPSQAPTVTTGATHEPINDTLFANQVPWTNFNGQNVSNYDYSQTTQPIGVPGTASVAPPLIIGPLPAGTQSVTLVISGTATVNGSVQNPSTVVPTGPTFPGRFGVSSVVVMGAFTDANGNVIPPVTGGTVEAVIPAGQNGTFPVPAGAVQLQLGINSQDPATGTPNFTTNSGSFSVTGTINISSFASVPSSVGTITAYIWGDSPQTGPVGIYIWKNPSDVGSGTPRSIGGAPVTTTNNSWQIDLSASAGGNPVTAPQWDQLTSEGVVSGDIPLFSTPFSQSTPNFTNFNACVVGSIFFPTGGTVQIKLQYKDQIMLGIGGGVTATYVSGNPPLSPPNIGSNGQTISVANSLPLVFVSTPQTESPDQETTLNLAIPAGGGVFQFELDWDYWFHSGRSLVMQIPSTGIGTGVIPPLPSGVRTNVVYYAVYVSSKTGAMSNPSPASAVEVTPVLNNIVSAPFSPDPQVDKVYYYRQDSGLPNPVLVGIGPNTNPPTPIIDSQTDLAVANNPQLEFDNFEPVPSIDLPASGTANVSGGVITAITGKFNTRWLPGTVIDIGAPAPFGQPLVPQIAYTFISRPTTDSTVTIPGVPDGTNLTWNIAEPALAAQPLPYIWGPTDNINYAFGVGDPLRPGTLYWSKGSNLDSWPDTNQMDVTDPSEPLVNGAMSAGLGVVFSIRRAWVIYPNFFNALATVTGTSGSTWTLQATGINRGLFMPRCLFVTKSGTIFFRVDDGIHISHGGGASISITDGSLYPLFSHEGSTPVAITRNGVTIYPPDDSKPQKQKFAYQNGYMYYDHVATDGQPHTWIFDERAEGWIWDLYQFGPPTAHAANEGESQQGILVGGEDGTVRLMESTGPETVTGTVVSPALGGQGWVSGYQFTAEYRSAETVTVSFSAADEGNGSFAPQPLTLPATGGLITKFTTKVTPNKWKLLQVEFQSTDEELQVYHDGCSLSSKPFGSDAQYTPVPLFTPAGGRGPQE